MALMSRSALAAAVFLVSLVLSQGAMAAVSVEDVTGNAGESVVVSLFVNGLSLTSVPGAFDLQVVLDFDSDLTLVTAESAPAAAAKAQFLWGQKLGPNFVGFSAMYDTDPGAFLNAEMLRLTFQLGADADAGRYAISANPPSYAGASVVVPLPPALPLIAGSLALLAARRRRI